jgi:peptide/nickel transport system substrate-binding protein
MRKHRLAPPATPAPELSAWIEDVREGRLPRRDFIARLAALGLPAPMAGLALLQAGVAQSAPAYPGTRRGGGGTLRLLFWQGPTLLNPQFANGTKDSETARVFYEPLAHWDPEGRLLPILAEQLPTRENGGLSADGKSVIWTLKQGVSWHDGQPFTADDVIFTWQYVTNPATAASTAGSYEGVKLEKLDSHRVRAVFERPSPFWPGTYSVVRILPRHVFGPYAGARSREAPANLKPVGTGPYRFVEFKPGDLVRAELNPNYHMPNRPFFDQLEIKGGGDSVSAARAVLQTGEFDYAWNLQVEDEVLVRMEAAGKGRVEFLAGGAAETIYLNTTDPHHEVDGERASPKSTHPLFSDPAVRKAIGLLVDRASVQKFIYGRAGGVTANFLVNPPRFRSSKLKPEFDVDKANALLDAAGWKREGGGGADGVRSKNGRALRLLFQTTTNPVRQKTQALVKQAAQKAGIAIELKSVSGSVFFSSDLGNPDTSGKFWADMQMYTTDQGRPDPQRYMQRFTSAEVSCKANKWSGLNITRWRNAAYDAAFQAAERELDAVKRAALFVQMNDLVCGDGYVVPLIYRPNVAALGKHMVATLSGWDNELGSLHDWYRSA